MDSLVRWVAGSTAFLCARSVMDSLTSGSIVNDPMGQFFFKSAVQFTTRVSGAEPTSPAVTIRKRWPSRVTS